MTPEQIKNMKTEDIAAFFDGLRKKQQRHEGLTWEDGNRLLGIVGEHGQWIAERILYFVPPAKMERLRDRCEKQADMIRQIDPLYR